MQDRYGKSTRMDVECNETVRMEQAVGVVCRHRAGCAVLPEGGAILEGSWDMARCFGINNEDATCFLLGEGDFVPEGRSAVEDVGGGAAFDDGCVVFVGVGVEEIDGRR
jgi:hypothetical protein